MKFTAKPTILCFLLLIAFSSCNSDDPAPSDTELNSLVDGWYIMGSGTAVKSGNLSSGLMSQGINAVDQMERPELHSIFLTVKAGEKGFSLVNISSKTAKFYGPDDLIMVDSVTRATEPDCIKYDFQRGTVAASDIEDAFTVPQDGLYQIVFDELLKTIAIVPIHVLIYGDVIPCENKTTYFEEEIYASDSVAFSMNELYMQGGSWKYQLSGGNKVYLSDEVAFNTTLGTSLTGLAPEGSYFSVNDMGIFHVSLNWTINDGFSTTVNEIGDPYPILYPDSVLVLGEATSYGWDYSSSNASMHTCINPLVEGLFWKILYLEANKPLRIAFPCWSNKKEISFLDIDEFDTEGISVSMAQNGSDLMVSESGIFMVVIDFRDNVEKVSIKQAEVYGYGEAFGTWQYFDVATKFYVGFDKRTLESPTLLNDGIALIQPKHSWIPEPCFSQVYLIEDKIVYAGCNNVIESIAYAGQRITLNFDTNSGSLNYVGCCGY